MTRTLSIYQVDAFTDQLFGGNPAAVCPLDQWISDEHMQAIAAENNLAETAFFVAGDQPGVYQLRWFTPRMEIDLCGHATLATAHVMFEELGEKVDQLVFSTLSGPLKVWRTDSEMICMDFPSRPVREIALPKVLGEGLGTYVFIGKSRDYLVELVDEQAVIAFEPELDRIAQLDSVGLIVTAASQRAEIDFVSRFFAPRAGVDEDPVTGSAHCNLIPYWAQKLNRKQLVAQQLSTRLGTLWCEWKDNRVEIAGKAVTYLRGEISLPV